MKRRTTKQVPYLQLDAMDFTSSEKWMLGCLKLEKAPADGCWWERLGHITFGHCGAAVM